MNDRAGCEALVANGLSQTLGEVLIDCGDGRARLELQVTDGVRNPVGVLHGGALASLIDSAGTVAIACAAGNSDGRPGVTTDLHLSYLAPARDGTVVAAARIRRLGRTLAFAEVEVTRADGTLIALGRLTKFMAG
jgi:uncharacterized protein (TIGR00369 family)